LLGKGEDRNLGQIDLLAAREFEQQVEGTLEPVHIHQKRGFGVPLVQFCHILEGQFRHPNHSGPTPFTSGGRLAAVRPRRKA